MKLMCIALVVSISGAFGQQPPPDPKPQPPAQPGTPPAPTSGELTDALAIIKKTDDATKALKSVRYVGEVKWSGAFEKRPTISGSVVLAGEASEELDRYRFEVKIAGTAATPRELIAVSDGKVFTRIEHGTKTAYEGSSKDVLGDFLDVYLVIGMREFTHPSPFTDEIQATKLELQGSDKVGEQDCYKIHVVYANTTESTWWISKKDFLPRGVERVGRDPASGTPGSSVLRISELAADPAFATDPFKAVIPEGYKKEGSAQPATPPKGDTPGSGG